VSFIVVYRGTGAGSACEELPTLDDAVRFVEQIRNDTGVSDAQIFRAEPVPFDYRPYFRVEIAAAAPTLPKPTRFSRDMLLTPEDASVLDDARRGLFGR
jgi:hypothetical protein